VWCSVDPVRRKIDFYPKAIATKIEGEFAEWVAACGSDPSPGQCVLGSDFFNATVHFHPNGLTYQTTPGVSMGRSGFKQPGYRTVKRIVVAHGLTEVTLYAKRVSGEWRFCEVEQDAEHTFHERIPAESVITAQGGSAGAAATFQPWTASDMQSVAWDLPVVVWQWCRGVPERNGNLLQLAEDWWCPYPQDTNALLESDFQAGKPSSPVAMVGRSYEVTFIRGSPFALQQDKSRKTERSVRRVVKTVQELKMLQELMLKPTPSALHVILDALPEGAVPHHFLCPIFQDVMGDPVTTVDGHTYERAAIEKWFEDHETAPMTGLVLRSKLLTPDAELKKQIHEFVATHATPPTQTT